MTKLEGEKRLAMLPPQVERVILRPPVVYGKNDSGISKIASWIKRGVMLNPGAAGRESFFSFIFLDDLVKVLRTAVDDKNVAGKTYYVCEDMTYTWSFFVKQIAFAMDRKMPFMIKTSRSKTLSLGRIYETFAKLAGITPVFNLDKAKEACAGHWTASPKKWMADTGQAGWTPLPEGIKATFTAGRLDR